MEEEFELPINYKGQQLMLKASLQITGYTHKFNVDINGQIIVFEPDEERNYRAVINLEDKLLSRGFVIFSLLFQVLWQLH